jgi:hypothetical protein
MSSIPPSPTIIRLPPNYPQPGEAEPGEAEPPFTVYPNADGAGGVAIIVHSKPDSPKKLKKPRKKPTT